jgi:hypothetical protein
MSNIQTPALSASFHTVANSLEIEQYNASARVARSIVSEIVYGHKLVYSKDIRVMQAWRSLHHHLRFDHKISRKLNEYRELAAYVLHRSNRCNYRLENADWKMRRPSVFVLTSEEGFN